MIKYVFKYIFYYFWQFHFSVLRKNKSFKDKHKGETCYIFGNGASLKFFDISKLPKHITIATTFSLFDKRMKYMKPEYYILPDQYNFYPFTIDRDKYGNKIKGLSLTVNYLSTIFKKIINDNPETLFFTSITNFYSFMRRPKNLNYFAVTNIFKNELSKPSYDLSKDFNCLDGSLDIMIGTAKYLGFSKAILVGCDYLGTPKYEGHFYSDESPYYGKSIHREYLDRIKSISSGIELMTIFPDDIKSSLFKLKSIKEFNNIIEKYINNYDIISPKDLNLLRNAADNRQLHMKTIK